jgi:hypothetical protein
MPTAARLVAALALGLACPLMYFVFNAQYPDLRLDLLRNLLMGMLGAVGFLVGWFSLGRRVTGKLGSGFVLGMRAAVTITVWALFLCALYYVLDRIAIHAYREPMEAILALFDKMTEYALYLLNWRIAGLALLIGVTCGTLSENAARRWN